MPGPKRQLALTEVGVTMAAESVAVAASVGVAVAETGMSVKVSVGINAVVAAAPGATAESGAMNMLKVVGRAGSEATGTG